MNSFGIIFRVSLFGESHGPAVGVMIDGCPSGIPISEEELNKDLDRRRAGAKGTTPRKEHDIPEIISGIFNGKTSGAPIVIMTRNTNIKPHDYDIIKNIPRPGHADFTSELKYKGYSDKRGGGHFSGRLTWGLVVAGTIARKVIQGVQLKAEISEVGGLQDIEKALSIAAEENDSVGALITCCIDNVPAGLGEPFFNSVESSISHIVFSIPAIKGIEFGSGFESASMKGSEHNDMIISADGETESNNAGGINGGISSGNQLVFRVAVKPTSSISLGQKTFDMKENTMVELNIEGRHDLCIALRIPVIVEAAAAIALADLYITDKGIYGERE